MCVTYSAPTWPTSATTPGAATSSSLLSGAEAQPLAGRQPAGPMHDGAPLTIALPPAVRAVLTRLAEASLEAALVGGSVRDLVSGTTPTDWDVATAGPPDQVAALFPGSSGENRFGTVTVRGEPDVEVTTYRHEGPYLDRRRPEHVRWGTSLADDLARRDFTVNAIAWRPGQLTMGEGTLVDPCDGIGDLGRG